MIADTIHRAGTLCVEDVAGVTTLCLNTGRSSMPLALFVSDVAAREFLSAFAMAMQVAHASGRSGI